MRTRIILAALIFPLFAFVSPQEAGNPDLSTPEKSFSFFVNILQSGATDQLTNIVTPTGIASVVSVAQHEDYQDGMTSLGQELAASELNWAEITDDIYFLTARFESRTHKMEFTKEEPGWMLYHHQLGGGVDSPNHGSDQESPDDFSFDD